MKDLYITNNITQEMMDSIIGEIHLYNNESKEALKTTIEDVHFANPEIKMTDEEALEQLEEIIDFATKPIRLHISSYGGEVYGAMAIVGAMQQSELPVETYAYGLVASAALLIFINGDNRHVSSMARLMYHSMSYGVETTTSEQIRMQVKDSDVLQQMIEDNMIENTEVPIEMLKDTIAYSKDLYLSAQEAIEYKVAEHMF